MNTCSARPPASTGGWPGCGGCATRPMALRSQADMQHAESKSGKAKGPATLNLFVSILLGLMIGAAPALAAVEQDRFIQAKADREACYSRQPTALPPRRNPAPPSATTRPESLQ